MDRQSTKHYSLHHVRHLLYRERVAVSISRLYGHLTKEETNAIGGLLSPLRHDGATRKNLSTKPWDDYATRHDLSYKWLEILILPTLSSHADGPKARATYANRCMRKSRRSCNRDDMYKLETGTGFFTMCEGVAMRYWGIQKSTTVSIRSASWSHIGDLSWEVLRIAQTPPLFH